MTGKNLYPYQQGVIDELLLEAVATEINRAQLHFHNIHDIDPRPTQIDRQRARYAMNAIAEGTGGVPESRPSIVIEVRGGVVQDVLNVPPGVEYEIKDYDSLDEPTETGRAA
jgi:hypothetical protein